MKFLRTRKTQSAKPSLPVRGAWIEMLLFGSMSAVMLRRSPCGERGLKFCFSAHDFSSHGRSPCGERGLKCEEVRHHAPCLLCRSPCGERGLKFATRHNSLGSVSRSPCGERGLKYASLRRKRRCMSRSPCGERGLKSAPLSHASYQSPSLPVRGAWIEIFAAATDCNVCQRRSPCGERGLKSCCCCVEKRSPYCRSPCGERGLK